MNKEVRTLDVRGLNCPMPLLKTKQALNGMNVDECIRVLATDPGSVRDFEVFCRQSGHLMIESDEQEGIFTYLLQKSA